MWPGRDAQPSSTALERREERRLWQTAAVAVSIRRALPDKTAPVHPVKCEEAEA
jgi:hypothetical protein